MFDEMVNRRSIRKYQDRPVTTIQLDKILAAGQFAPTGKNKREWEFLVVEGKGNLKKLSETRKCGSKMLEDAAAAIVIMAKPEDSDTWVEDCSISMAYMHLMASSLGLGSCWIQVRNRNYSDTVTSTDYLKAEFDIPVDYSPLAILSLGWPDESKEPHSFDEVVKEKVHYEKF